MPSLSEAVPMRWLCGPLDIQQREKQEGFTARSAEALKEWLNPSSLKILRGSPVNCVVVNWAAGLPVDSEHQQALMPLIKQAASGGLLIVGIVQGESGRQAAIESARAAGLSAIMAGDGPAQTALPMIPLAARPHLPWSSSAPVLAATGNVWPGVASEGLTSQAWRSGTDAEAAGPTADPWIDSNGWFLRLGRTYAPSKKIWLLFEPPSGPNPVPVNSYHRALSDTGMYGGRWVLTLDEALRHGVTRDDQRALDTVKTIFRTLAFFEGRRDWLTHEPLGMIGVISDYSGPNEMVGTEVLNLTARRSLPFRILKTDSSGNLPRDLKAVVCVDEALPSPALLQSILAFVRGGGVLLASERWKDQGGTSTGLAHPRLDIRRLGQGKLAICKTESPDPYMVARDIHVQLGRVHDLIRFFNISAFLGQYDGAPIGSIAVLQMTNFANRPTDDLVTVWFSENYRSARLWTVESANPVPLSLYAENGGIDVEVPAFSTYAAVEISKTKLA